MIGLRGVSSSLLRVRGEVLGRTQHWPTSCRAGVDHHHTWSPLPSQSRHCTGDRGCCSNEGAVPATTAFLDGQAHVGLDKHQIARLAENGVTATKTSRRDIASVLAAGRGSIGATTVSGTMVLSHLAGISIFGTGGIGGVHRGAETSMDVSADLTELSRSPVSVFCSGAKSILDIPRTLEYLETLGVPVHTFHSEGQFPAFYTANSGCTVPQVSSVLHAALMIKSNSDLGLSNGLVFGVPIPAEYEEAGKDIQKLVERALLEASELGIDNRGKEVTPWLLKRISELSQGNSINSNKALVVNNVATAARVAVELAKLRAADREDRSQIHCGLAGQRGEQGESPAGTPPLVVIGATAVDIVSQIDNVPHDSAVKSTWPGQTRLTLGGVARNIAETAHRLLASRINSSSEVSLISPVGRDVLGSLVKERMKVDSGLSTKNFVESGGRTASVTLQLDRQGDLISGVADIDESQLTDFSVTEALRQNASTPRVVCFDGNVSRAVMSTILSNSSGVSLFEPTSVAKCTKIVGAGGAVDIITPNEAELQAMYQHAVKTGLIDAKYEHTPRADLAASLIAPEAIVNAGLPLSRLLRSVLLVKRGASGVVLIQAGEAESPQAIEAFTPLPIPTNAIKSTTGCGDTFAGVIAACAHLMLHKHKLRPRQYTSRQWSAIIHLAQRAAGLTLQSDLATSADLEDMSEEMREQIDRLCLSSLPLR